MLAASILVKTVVPVSQDLPRSDINVFVYQVGRVTTVHTVGYNPVQAGTSPPWRDCYDPEKSFKMAAKMPSSNALTPPYCYHPTPTPTTWLILLERRENVLRI